MRNFTVSIYYVKAAELNVIRTTATKLLRGLDFATVYTPHFAMCTDSLSEILLTTNAPVVETRSVMRFSCSGIFPKPELKKIGEQMDTCRGFSPETVGLWRESEPVYFDKAVAKATQSLHKTFKELSGKAGNSFTIMIINNDTLPLFELLAAKDYYNLETAHPGEVIQFRFEVSTSYRNILNWRLLHTNSTENL